ncbi:hypothetical protein HXX76_012108 [Chlamydomonas incerta]|uniref:Protein kinase domain-containing protein n=1 Tax=Chlamydomonas incerta TaxID=51695 RepID=A0A835VVW9_CHLIN|nr:hypothetical protein HXX76_012108 [Chlamydomonas incerta]|eukprot:KAG2427783.1 hypothetical protein HXX76_012108 [Chlamydomonas incerta]
MARVVDALAGRLPALEELEFRDFDVDDAAGAEARTHLTLSTIADFFPRLRRLVLPLPDGTAPAGLGALAACTQLRELTMVAGETMDLTPAALEGLHQLQRLERLTLGRFRLRAGDERLVAQLLTTHRPPNLLNLKLQGRIGSFLEVDFERAGGRRGMRCLQQLTVPELAVVCLMLSKGWRPPQYVQPGDPLPRLVARCGRVEVGGLNYERGAAAWDPAPVLAVVRLMGLPRGLHMAHGSWGRQAQELALRGAAVGAAEAAGQPAGGPAAAPSPVERRQTKQMTRLQRQQQLAQQQQQQQQQQQGVRPQQLQLDTATPEQVLLRAVDELAAEAAQAGGTCGGGGGGGSRCAGVHMLILRGALPPRDAGSMGWAAWMKGAVEHCVRLAAQDRARQQPERSRGAGGALRTAGPPSSARVLERCWELIEQECDHIAAPAAGVLLLRCSKDQRAAELASLLSGAAGASSVQRRGDTGSARAVTAAVIHKQTGDRYALNSILSSRIFKVLTDMWARSQQGGGRGTSSKDGGGGGGGSDHKVADEDALWQLLALDHGVKQLWAFVQHPFRPESDSDPGTDADDADDDDEDDEDDGLVWMAKPSSSFASTVASDADDHCAERRSYDGSNSDSSATASGRSSCDGSRYASEADTTPPPAAESLFKCSNAAAVTPPSESPPQITMDEQAPAPDTAARQAPTCHVVSELACADPYTRVEVVDVLQPDGGSSSSSRALRLTLLRKHKVTGKPRRKPGNPIPLLLQHLDRLRAAHQALGGSPHGARLLWESRPARESEPHVLLLSYQPWARSLESFLDCLAMDEIQRDFDAMLASPKPERPPPSRRQNPSSTAAAAAKTAPLPFTPTLVLTRRTLVPEPLLKRLAVALLSSLAALHEAGICHGAIEPACVSVASSSSPDVPPASALSGSSSDSSSTRFVVMGCGLAARVDEAGVLVEQHKRMRVPASALEYAAPEMRAHLAALRAPVVGAGAAAGDTSVAAPVTAACDVASVGLLLLDAAAFRATAGGLRAYTEGRLGLPARLPQGLRDLVAGLTAADVSQRLTARGALAHPYLQQ